VSQITLLGVSGVGGARSYGGLVEERSGLELLCDNSGYMNDILRKLLAFKVNHIGKEKLINFSRQLALSREEENGLAYHGAIEKA
jgi:hypothetical protein